MQQDQEYSNPSSASPETVNVETRIDELVRRYQFHDIIKKSAFSRHYIVEDLEADPNVQNPIVFHFLKQNFYTSEEEFKYALDYYQRLQRYCKTQFAKNDIIKLNQIYFADFKNDNYFELALVMDIGEPDRIDIENIQSEHITKFLKTVCNLLEDLKKFDQIYHGNICLKNIVLVLGELKLSGFKPIYLGDTNYKNWKTQLCQAYGHFRTDLYMIGLIWLRFLGVKIDDITQTCKTLPELRAYVNSVQEQLPHEKKMTIVMNLLDLDNQPDLSLEDVILQFEEFFVLEEIKNSNNKNLIPDALHNLNVFDLENASMSEKIESISRPKTRSENQTENVFNQQMKESEQEMFTYNQEPNTPKEHKVHDFLKIDGEFTLQDEDSIMVKPSSKLPDGRGLIDIQTTDKKDNESIDGNLIDNAYTQLINSERNVFNVPEKKDEEATTSLRNVKSANDVQIDKSQAQNDHFSKKDSKQIKPLEKLIEIDQEEYMDLKIATPTTLRESKNSTPTNLINQLNKSQPIPTENSVSKREKDFESTSKKDHERTAQGPAPEWVDSSKIAKKIELTDEQLEQIEQEAVNNYLQQKESEHKKSVQTIKALQEKHNAQNIESERLKEKIQELSEKKISQKSVKISVQGDKKIEQEKKNQNQNRIVKDAAPVISLKPAETSQKQASALPITKKPKNKKFGVLDDPKKAFGLSTVKDREQLFSFNHEMKNKNITFKKMLNKIEPIVKVNGTENFEGRVLKVSNELQKNLQSSNLNELINDKTMKKSLEKIGDAHPNEFSEIKKTLTIKQIEIALEEAAGLPISEAEIAPEKVDTLCNLEMRFLTPEQNLPLEDAIETALAQNDLAEAVTIFKNENSEIQLLPKIHLQVLSKFYSFFRKHPNEEAKKALLYDLINVLSQNNDFDPKRALEQELTIELSRLEYKHKNYENALKILQSRAFEESVADTEGYYNQLGEAFLTVNDQKNAAKIFEKLLNENVADSFIHFDVTRVFLLIFKVFQLLNQSKNYLKLGKFFNKVLAILQNIKKVNSVLSLRDNDYENLVESYVLNTLRYSREIGNHNFTNFVLHECVSKKLIDAENNLNELERKELVEIIVEFCGQLSKIENYGGFKDNYAQLLDFAKAILKHCDLTAVNLKSTLNVSFTRGLFFIKEENYPKAQEIFGKCLNSYYSFFERTDTEMFRVLFDLGENLQFKEKYAEAVYYFAKVLELNCGDVNLLRESLKQLAKLHFRLANFKKCMEYIEKYLDRHFEKNEANGYWKYMTMYFVCAVKTDWKSFNAQLSEIKNQQDASGSKVFGFYNRMFSSLVKIHENHHEFKENYKFFNPIEDVAKNEKDIDQNSKKLAVAVASIYFKYVENKSEKIDAPYKNFIKQFIDPFLTVSENSDLLIQFIINICFAIVNLIPLYKERVHNHEYRQNIVDNLKKHISKALLKHTFNEDIKNANFEQESKKNLLSSSKFQKQIIVENSRLNKSTSNEFLQTITKDPRVCFCFGNFNNNVELQNLAKEFLTKIKEMLFLDLFEDILTYYARFEKTLVEKNICFQKYDFIKQLITFHIVNTKKKHIDQSLFDGLMDQLFGFNSLCWHDLKFVILILESFKNMDYLKFFAVFLDKHHENYSSLIFNDLFLNSFNRKFMKMISSLYNQTQTHKLVDLENHFSMRQLQSDEYGKTDYAVDFLPFARSRYALLNDESFQELFNRHLNFDELVNFYLRFLLFDTIYAVFKQPEASHNEILRKFKNGMLALIIKLKIDESHLVDLMYQILLLAKVMKFDKPEEMSEAFLKIMLFLLNRFNFEMNYQYSRIFGELGKVFFKCGNFKATAKACLIAKELVEDENKVHIYEPNYVIAENREVHYFQLHAFVISAFLEEKKIDNAQIFVQKIERFKTENEILKLDRKILQVMRNLGFSKSAEAMRITFDMMNEFDRLSLSQQKKKLYQAILDKLSLLIILQTEKNESGLEQKTQKSRDSILNLYN